MLYTRSDIYKVIKKKHGQDVITAVPNYGKVKIKFMKVNQDIKCRKNRHLVQTFVKLTFL